MMKLLIDIGNTLCKIAIFDNQQMLYFANVEKLHNERIKKLSKEFPQISHVIISSVAGLPGELVSLLNSLFKSVMQLNSNTLLPFKLDYKTPETLGLDRIAIVAGANYIFPKHNVLAIDMGTAITYDFLTSDGIYKGGNISPGMQIRFKSLNMFTKNLPLLSSHDGFPFLGNSTENAIVSGVQTGIIFEIDAYIDRLRKEYFDLKVVLSGGDCFFFAEKLKNTIFVERDIVLKGLNRILNFNILNSNNE